MCNTDHQMLLVEVKLRKKFHRRGSKDRLVKRFDVTNFKGPCHDARERELLTRKFVFGVREGLKRSWIEASSV